MGDDQVPETINNSLSSQASMVNAFLHGGAVQENCEGADLTER